MNQKNEGVDLSSVTRQALSRNRSLSWFPYDQVVAPMSLHDLCARNYIYQPPVPPVTPQISAPDVFAHILLLVDELRLLKAEVARFKAALTRCGDGETPATPKATDDNLAERVDRMIVDVLGHRVTPRKVDELGDAVARSQRDRAIGRAIRNK